MAARTLFGLLMILHAHAFAEWKVVHVVIKVDTRDPTEIADTLPDFIALQNQLIARELTHPAKSVVDHLQAELDLVQWENDAKCQVADPSKVPLRNVIPLASVGFHFADAPERRHGNWMRETPISPCGPMALAGREMSETKKGSF